MAAELESPEAVMAGRRGAMPRLRSAASVCIVSHVPVGGGHLGCGGTLISVFGVVLPGFGVEGGSGRSGAHGFLGRLR